MNLKNTTSTSSNPKSSDIIKPPVAVDKIVYPTYQFYMYEEMENEPREDSIHYGLFDWRDEEIQLSHGTAAWDKVGWSRDGWVF